MRAGIQHAAMHDGVARVARGEQHQQIRTLLPRLIGKLPAGHAARQPDIGEQQADRRIARQQLQPRPSIGCRDHPVAQLAQRLGAVGTHRIVIFDHQHQFA